jgi:hypothetical protein
MRASWGGISYLRVNPFKFRRFSPDVKLWKSRHDVESLTFSDIKTDDIIGLDEHPQGPWRVDPFACQRFCKGAYP